MDERKGTTTARISHIMEYLSKGGKMTPEIVSLIVAAAGFLASVYYSQKTAKKADMDDIIKRTEANTKISTKLDGIASDVKETAKNVDRLREDLAEHGSRITAVEQSVKSAHHRIDSLIKLHNYYCGKDDPYREKEDEN